MNNNERPRTSDSNNNNRSKQPIINGWTKPEESDRVNVNA